MFFQYRFIWLALLLAITIALGIGVAFLQFDYSPHAIFSSDSPEYLQLQQYTKTFGKSDLSIGLMFKSKKLFQREYLAYIEKLSAKIATIEHLTVYTLFDFLPAVEAKKKAQNHSWAKELKKQALKQPWLHRLFLSEDADTMLVQVNIAEKMEQVANVTFLVEKIQQIIAQTSKPSGLELYISGIPFIRANIIEKIFADQMLYMPVCGALFGLILIFLFRRFSYMFLALGVIAIVLIWILGLMGWSGKSIDILNNNITIIVFTIAISDCIHLLSRYLTEAQKQPQQEAIWKTLEHLAIACFFTSFTTAIGFGSLYIAKIHLLKDFGVYTAIAMIFAYIVTVLALPLALSFTKPATRLPQNFSWNMEALAKLTIKYPRRILFIGILLIGAIGSFGYKVKVNNYLLETLPRNDAAYAASQVLEQELSGMIPTAVVFSWQKDELSNPKVLKTMDNFSRFWRQQAGIRYVASPVDLIKEAHSKLTGSYSIPENSGVIKFLTLGIIKFAPDAWHKLVNSKEKKARIIILSTDMGARTLLEIQEKFQKEYLDKMVLGNVKIIASDLGIVANAAIQSLIYDLRNSLLLAFAIIFVTIAFLFRSLKIAFISMIPNIAPLVIAYGYLGIVGLELQLTTIFVFPIALGLAVDDSIHFLVHYRQSIKEGLSIEDAIKATFSGAGKAIVFTSLLLGVGFMVLLLSNFPASHRFAMLMEIIIFSAMVGDLLLLPACIVIFKAK